MSGFQTFPLAGPASPLAADSSVACGSAQAVPCRHPCSLMVRGIIYGPLPLSAISSLSTDSRLLIDRPANRLDVKNPARTYACRLRWRDYAIPRAPSMLLPLGSSPTGSSSGYRPTSCMPTPEAILGAGKGFEPTVSPPALPLSFHFYHAPSPSRIMPRCFREGRVLPRPAARPGSESLGYRQPLRLQVVCALP